MNDNTLIENHKKLLRNYINAKDDNKPYLMKSVFADSATLEMEIKTDSISFPSQSDGLDEITRVLVRNFSQSYENVYTFCFTDSFKSKKNTMSCNWMVGMNERESGNIRVGFGRYNWRFNEEKNPLTYSLKITIEQMLILKPSHSEKIMSWIQKIPYPFCETNTALKLMPEIEQLQQIRQYFR